MIALMNECDRCEHEFDASADFDTFERFTHRRDNAFPVRSQVARTRGKIRNRRSVAARRKARSFNGINRRGRGKYSFPLR